MNIIHAGTFIVLEKLLRLCIHSKARGWILRSFGATIGCGVRVHEVFLSGLWNGFKNLTIADNAFIGDGTFIDLTGKVTIGSRTSIAPRCVLITHEDPGSMLKNQLSKFYSRKVGEIHIGNDTWIGAGTIILCGVNIGNKVIIGAGSLVNKDIPDNTIAFGIPAVIREKIS